MFRLHRLGPIFDRQDHLIPILTDFRKKCLNHRLGSSRDVLAPPRWPRPIFRTLSTGIGMITQDKISVVSFPSLFYLIVCIMIYFGRTQPSFLNLINLIVFF